MKYIILDVIQNYDYIEDIKCVGSFLSEQDAQDYIDKKIFEMNKQIEDRNLYIKNWIEQYVPDHFDYPKFWRTLFKTHTQYTISVFQDTRAYPPNFENTLMNYLYNNYQDDKEKGAELIFDFNPPSHIDYFPNSWRIVKIPEIE